MAIVGPMSDPLYRKLYSSPRMVADLLRAVAPEVARRLDFSTLDGRLRPVRRRPQPAAARRQGVAGAAA